MQRYLGGKGIVTNSNPRLFVSPSLPKILRYTSGARTADKLVLTDSKGEKSYYRAKGDALEMLDREGNPIESQFNYTLEPAQPFLAVLLFPR